MTPVRCGIEIFIDDRPAWAKNERLGLLCNPASVDRRFRHARELVAEAFPGRLKALFSPQHGFFAAKQDNMIESADTIDPLLGIPVFSLYGTTRTPTAAMLEPIDTLLVDLQDVGTRVYTFIYTLSYCMEAAKVYGKKIVVMDRPNPINGIEIEGNVLSDDCRSFVGRFPLPMRHGLTVGEIAAFFNDACGIGCNLQVIPMAGWRRGMYFEDTGLPWVPPSPNLPTPQSAIVYPGQVIWEGTNVSEGRGTTQPFELFGAPFIDPKQMMDVIGESLLSGCVPRPAIFEPTSGKWMGTSCGGFQIHVTDPSAYRPYKTTLAMLQAVLKLYPDRFAWKQPPYEYEFERMPIDLIIGNRTVRRRVEQMASIDEIEHGWQPELKAFDKQRRRYWIYRE